jgi:hypothetical protein
MRPIAAPFRINEVSHERGGDMAKPNLSVKDLGKLLQDSKAISDIGRQQIAIALENIVEEKAGIKMSAPMTHIRIERGETVPGFLAGTPGIVEALGRAAPGEWEKSWLNVIVWERAWSDGPVIAPGTIVQRDFVRGLVLQTFDDDEKKVLQDAGIL